MMINKNRFRVSNDKKVLHKIGKHWVTVSALTLALLGGAAAASTVTTHAASVQTAPTEKVAEKPAQSATPKNIMSAASNMHRGMLAAAPKSVASSVSDNAKSSSASQSASNVSNSKISSAVSGVTSGSSVASFSSVNSSASAKSIINSSASNKSVVHMLGGDNPLEVQAPKAAQQQTDTNWIYSNGEYISDNHAGQWKTNQDLHQSAYYGLSWKYNEANKAVEFTDGTLTWNGGWTKANTPFLSQNPYIAKANSVKFDDNVDTSKLSNTKDMFYDNSSLQSLDLGNRFNTNNVNCMLGMFSSDNNLKEIYLPNTFNTSKVTTMDWMFNQDHNLQSLDLHALDTHNVTSMMGMFMRDFNLKSLTLPSTFNTSKVTNMLWMFRADTGLQSLNLGPNFDTSNVTNMASMFSDEYSLPALNLGNNFDTSKVTNMEHMFDSDYILKNLNLGSKFNTNNASDMYMMFIRDGKNLSSNDGINITLSPSFNTSKAMANNLANTDQGTHNGISDMFQHANVHSLTIPQGANFKLNEQANLGDLYPKGLNTTTPHDFNQSVSNNVGTFTQLNIQASDIYGNTDGNNRPFTIDSSNQNNYRFVDRDGRITNTPIQNNGKYMVAPVYGGLTYKYNEANKSIEFVSGNTSDLTWFMNRHDMPNYIHTAQHIKFDDGINVSNATSMYNFCNVNPYIHSIDLGDNFDTHNITTMQYAFSACPNLTSINLGKKFNAPKLNNANGMFSADSKLSNLDLSMMNTTSDLKNISWMLNTGSILKSLKFSPNFNTNSVNNMTNMFQGTIIRAITNPSKFNSTTQLGDTWYPVASKNNQLETDGNGNYLTVPNAQPVNLVDNNGHAGTWVKNPNVQKVNNTIAFTNDKTNDLVGSTTAYGALDSSYTIPNAPKGYSFINNDNTFKIVSPDTKVSIPVTKSNATDNANKDIPVAPTRDTDTIDYQYNNATKGSQQFSGNDQHATDAGDNSIDVDSKAATKMPAGYQLVNKDNNVPYDNGTHNVAITPIQQTDNIQFMNNGHQVGTTTTKGNDSRTGINDNSTATLPTGYQLAKGASASVANDGQTHQINVTPVQKTDTIDYQLDGVTKGSNQCTGNDSQANGATGTSFDVNSANDAGIPQGYQLVDKDNRFNYDGGTHNVAIEATDQSAKVNYNLQNGTNISSGTISGTVNGKATPNQAPQGYHFVGNVAPYNFTTANAGNNPSDNVTVAPNTYSGKATLHIKYDLGNGNIINGSDQHVNVHGQYGQSDQVVSSTDYCPMNDAYQDHNANWLIGFNDLTKNGSVSNGKLEHTFTYNATAAPSLVIRYDLINQGNDKLIQKDIHDDTFTASQLGIKPQDWVVGNTITVGTKRNGDTNKLDVISAPQGYHLVDNANGYDYKNSTESIQLEPNATVSGHPVILMAMPMFFHHSQPNKPVTPSSASAKPSSAASSVAPSSASASVAPSSASQSTSSSAPARQIIDHGSIEPKGNTPEPVNTPISTPSNKPSDVTPANQPSDVVPVVHKHTTKPSVQKNTQPSDQIVNKNAGNTKAESKPLVEPSLHAAKVQHEAQNHMANISNEMAQPTVHATNIHASHINNAKRSANTQHKLPQTNEAKAAGLMGAASIMTALGLAGADTDRKRQRE